ncbi:hypothetical protein O9929_20855 [Vibrio lentus]|nr:hypothetical protein [Vibrio lentus]
MGAVSMPLQKAWLHDIYTVTGVKEFAKDNIRFNIVSPGTIDTVLHDGKSDELKSYRLLTTSQWDALAATGIVAPLLLLSLHRTLVAATSQDKS